MAKNPKEKQREYSAKWRKNNREKSNEASSKYRKLNKEKANNAVKKWYKLNKARINENIKNRCKIDINFKLSRLLRIRLNNVIKGNFKSGSAIQALGCTLQELKEHLEKQFKEGMTWDNWTINGWHIDHIKPLSKFDLTDRVQLLEACHYTNLQPLWASDNINKSDKEI